MVSEATVRKVLQLRSEGRTYTEIERSARISRPTVAKIVSGRIKAKEPEPRALFRKICPAERCKVCCHKSTVWSTDKDQCWACTVRESL